MLSEFPTYTLTIFLHFGIKKQLLISFKNMKTKKPFFETVVGKIVKFLAVAIIKNQKRIKGTPNADKVDKLGDSL